VRDAHPTGPGDNPKRIVMPAKAGIQNKHCHTAKSWIPAFAGMTNFCYEFELLGLSQCH
jgi:hypothetical protein